MWSSTKIRAWSQRWFVPHRWFVPLSFGLRFVERNSVQYNLFISEGEHVAGELHVTCDRLSRGIRPLELGFSPETIYDVASDRNMLAIIELCNPAPENDILDEESFLDFWVVAREHVAQL